jgi:hypothetical protein
VDQLVGVREAARQVGVSASTISRQIKAGIIPNRGSAEQPRVDLGEVRAARAQNLDPSKVGNAAGMLLGEASAAEPLEEDDEDLEAEEPRAAGGAGEASYRAARTAREGFQAALAKLQYEEKAGLLVSRLEVERALVDASRQVRDALMRLGDKLAGELVGQTDPAAIARVINREHRQVLERLAEVLQQRSES